MPLALNLTPVTVTVVIIAYAILLFTSGPLVYFVLSRLERDYKKGLDARVLDTGVVVGKCENLLIPTFMILGAYTALALIFGVKAIVRSEDMSGKNTLYYLAGTMINVTYSVLVGAILSLFLTAF